MAGVEDLQQVPEQFLEVLIDGSECVCARFRVNLVAHLEQLAVFPGSHANLPDAQCASIYPHTTSITLGSGAACL